MESDKDFEVIVKVLKKLNLDQEYEKTFRDQAFTDEDAITCIKEGESEKILKQLIPKLGHLMKFTAELSKEAGIESVKAAKEQDGEPETDEQKPHDTSTQNAEVTARKSQPTQPISIWGKVATFFGFTGSSEKVVSEQLVNSAVKMFEDHVETKLNEDSLHLEPEDFTTLMIEAEDGAYQLIEQAMEHFADNEKQKQKVTDKLENQLMQRQKHYKGFNEAKKKKMVVELGKLADEVCQKWATLEKLREECGHGFVDEGDFVEAWDLIRHEADLRFQESAEDNPLYDPKILESRLEKVETQLRKLIVKRNKEILATRETLLKQCTEAYEDQMKTIMDVAAFEPTSEAAILNNVQRIEKYIGLDPDSRAEVIAAFNQNIESEDDEGLKAKAYESFQRRLEAWEKCQADVIKKAVEVYANLMQPMISKPTAVYEATLDSKNMASRQEAGNHLDVLLQRLSQTFPIAEQKNIEFKDVLRRETGALFTQYVQNNNEKLDLAKGDIELIVDQLKAEYSTRMAGIAEIAEDRKEFQEKSKALKDELDEKLKDEVKRKVSETEYLKEKLEELHEFMEEEREEHLEVFILKQQETEIHVKSAIHEAEKYYGDEMNTRFMQKEWFETEELKKLHEEVLAKALQECEEEITLTELVEKKLRQQFQVVYMRYVEDNTRRCPHKVPAIGIDLGTTYSCAGVYMNGSVKIIPDLQSNERTTVPSCVAFNNDGTIDVGYSAKEKAAYDHTNVIYDAKRMIGRKFNDEDLQEDMKHWGFQVFNEQEEYRIRVREKGYRPEEISAKVLYKMKQNAEAYLNRTVTKAVVTVPAYFGNRERKATKDAAKLAGLEATIITEPTAAAMAYRLHRTSDLSRNVLVFDLGGGTFDVAILSMEGGEMKVIVHKGNKHLGGQDFDRKMVDAIVERVKEKFDIDLARGLDSEGADHDRAKRRLARLRAKCEAAKRDLAESQRVVLEIDTLDDNFDLREEFTREEFNELNKEKFEECIRTVDESLEEAKMKKKDIHDIVLVGGSTRIVKIQEMLKAYFEDRRELTRRVNADEAVAYGAALQAALLDGEQPIEDEHHIRLQDVTPHSLGVAHYPRGEKRGVMCAIINKNRQIPCRETYHAFTTSRDNQTVVDVEIFEGEQKYATDNINLGKFQLTGIEPAPAETRFLSCTMIIDKEGILTVEAKDETSGIMASLQVQVLNGRMTNAEIETAMRQPVLRWR